MRTRPVRQALLRERLDALARTFDIRTISPDPLEVVLRSSDRLDQEIIGLLAAAFAYGRAGMVVRNASFIVERMTPSPREYLLSFDAGEARERFSGFSHRFHKTPELVSLLACLAATLRRHGSLGQLFRRCYEERDRDIAPALTRFVEAILSANEDPGTEKALRYLLTSPRDGSACKRMNLYLRWMVRRTPPDLGLWSFADPAKLVVPLDTHIHRIATFLGLNRRKSADWKTARAITDRLARLDAADPVRYDFAICRLGILDRCSRRRSKENCDVCLLRDVCRFPLR